MPSQWSHDQPIRLTTFPAARSAPPRVALFASCLGEVTAPATVRATVTVLDAMGIELAYPAGQTCCGQPALNTGFPAAARTLARKWLDVFAPYPAIVTPSGSCAATVRHQYPRMFGDRWSASMERITGRVWEFTQFVDAFGAHLPLHLPASVTWHDSCHMLRSLGERSAPRRVLGRIDGLQVKEMVDADVCCGFGGTFSTSFPGISVAMADRKLAAAADAGAGCLVSADPGCLMHLSTRATARHYPLRARHIAEIVSAALQHGSAR